MRLLFVRNEQCSGNDGANCLKIDFIILKYLSFLRHKQFTYICAYVQVD